MSENANNIPASIPVEDLIAWHAGEVADINREQAQLEYNKQTAALVGDDIKYDLEAAKFRLAGRKEELLGFAAFLMSRTAKPDTIPGSEA